MSFSYPINGGPVTISETAGVSLTAAADASLNVASVSDPSGGISKYTYDTNGHPVTTIFTCTTSSVGSFKYYDLSGLRFPDSSNHRHCQGRKGQPHIGHRPGWQQLASDLHQTALWQR